MSGPAPKPAELRRRRNAQPGFEQLPVEGRVAPAPHWPLGHATEDELAKWEQLWRMPQAIKWEEMHCEDTVALYVRAYLTAVENMQDTFGVKLMNEVRQLDAKLGLSPKAMRDLRWEIEPVKEDAPSSSKINKGKVERVYIPGQ